MELNAELSVGTLHFIISSCTWNIENCIGFVRCIAATTIAVTEHLNKAITQAEYLCSTSDHLFFCIVDDSIGSGNTIEDIDHQLKNVWCVAEVLIELGSELVKRSTTGKCSIEDPHGSLFFTIPQTKILTNELQNFLTFMR